MQLADWWESFLTVTIVFVYLLLQLFGAANSIRRRLQAERSAVLGDSDAQSFALLRYFAPEAKVHQGYEIQGLVPKASEVSIRFEDLGMSLSSNGKCILEGVTGAFRAGSMSAIMGPSGAGKTTFMNALCGKAYYGHQTGEIYVNAKKSSISALKSVRGFVPQEDTVHEKLTVRENLWYSAKLGNPDFSCKEVENIVDDVLNVMQLTHVQHTVVGDSEQRGVSGGQKKRVNIGIELVSRPSVLMLDEPTSGLDSTTALSIIHSLKSLAEMGMTVIMSIHQPRYSLFELFDDVLLLGLGGRTAYLGPSGGALPYFEGLGFALPKNENPADWFMDVIAGKRQSNTMADFKPHMLFNCWAEHTAGLLPASPQQLSSAASPQQLSSAESPFCNAGVASSPPARSVQFRAQEEIEERAHDVSPSVSPQMTATSSIEVSEVKMIPVTSDVLLSPPCVPCPSPAILSPGARQPSTWRSSSACRQNLQAISKQAASLTPQSGSVPNDEGNHKAAAFLSAEGISSGSAVQAQPASAEAPEAAGQSSPAAAAKIPKSATPKALLKLPTTADCVASSSPSRAAERAARVQMFGPTLLDSPRRQRTLGALCKPQLPVPGQQQPLLQLQGALDCKWGRIDLDEDGVLNRTELSAMFSMAYEEQPSEAVLDELSERMGVEDGVLTKEKLFEFLLSLQGASAEQEVVIDIGENMFSPVYRGGGGKTPTPASRRYPSTAGKRSASLPPDRSLAFCSQYAILLHQSSVRWLRQWKQRAFSMSLIVLGAVIFGHESADKLEVMSPLTPLKLNVSHCALGLMAAMPCLVVFGSDRPMFWRMSSSGMNVLAFFLARVTLCIVDVMLFAYVWSSVWYVQAAAPYNFWTYFRAFRLSALSGATWGLLMSTMVPPHSSTLAVAVVILVMGSALSEPNTMAEAPGTYRQWLALVSPFTWSVGQNYLVEVDDIGQDKVLPFVLPIVHGYRDVMHFGSWQYSFCTYVASATLGAATLTASYLCLRFTHRGKQV